MKIKLSWTIFAFSLIVGIIFTILKVQGIITWPWLWITTPFWWPIAFYAFIVVFFFALVILCLLMTLFGFVTGSTMEGFKMAREQLKNRKNRY